MKSLSFIFCLILTSTVLQANDGKYAVSGIAPQLRINADAVIRSEELFFEIKSTKETILTHHFVITVFNENGDRWAGFSEYYDKFRNIVSADGFLYDASGTQLKKVRKKDMQDASGVDEETLMSDSRVRFHNFHHRQYPYTVEYNVVLNTRNTLFFPMWAPRPGGGVAVEKSTLAVSCPEEYRFRYKAFLYEGEPAISKEKKTTTSTWIVRNQPAIVKESFSPRWHEMATVVILGPGEFQIEGYQGNMDSWKDFGKFVYSLKAGRDQLPDNIRQTVHQLVDDLSDPVQKISRLYDYLQQNTRYVSVQLGIGGWQPFDAKYVAANGYGDCKALVNYMYSLLKEAGIPSCYTLIRGGRYDNYITEEFPAQQFNHVILCVPLQKDTVWLECTSQTLPAGYLGRFTADRPALVIDESGGKLVRTPGYGAKDNVQVRHVAGKLEKDGTLQLKAVTRYGGLQQDDVHGLINHLSRDKVKDYLHEQLDFATYEVTEFNYAEQKKILPEIDETLDITVSNYATVTGKRLFIIPNVMTRSYQKAAPDLSRHYDILLGMPYTDADTVEIRIPEGYEAEALPAAVSLETPFGRYQSSVSFKDGKIIYYRSMEQAAGRFPASDYSSLVKFYEDIYKADRSRVVLLHK